MQEVILLRSRSSILFLSLLFIGCSKDNASDSGSDSTPTDTGDGCVVHVALGGNLDEGCGAPASPCGSISAGIAQSAPGCRVKIAAGEYTAETGEHFPLVLSEGIELAGAGSESTVIDDTAGTTSDLFTNCNNKELTAVIVNNGEGNQIHGLRVNGQTGPNNAVTVLSLSGDLEIYEAVITGGQEGVFVESGTAYLHDLELTGSVHAALKPAGDANVTMERSTVHHNKDAVEPICDSTVTVKDSEIFCNGNGVEALANATTFASGNHIHSNNLGLAARGVTTQLTARGNLIEKNKVGVYEFAGSLDLGTTEDPGLNTLQDNRHIGVLTVVVADDTFAIGNTWQPNVDGTDADGQFSGAVSFSSSEANCPNMPLGNIDTAWDAECESGFSLQSGFQNVAIDNGSCHGENLVEVGDVVVSE